VICHRLSLSFPLFCLLSYVSVERVAVTIFIPIANMVRQVRDLQIYRVAGFRFLFLRLFFLILCCLFCAPACAPLSFNHSSTRSRLTEHFHKVKCTQLSKTRLNEKSVIKITRSKGTYFWTQRECLCVPRIVAFG